MPLDEWSMVFGGDVVIAMAILDRLLRPRQVFVITGSSGRMKGKPDPIGLFEFVGLKQELEELLGRKVDLVQYRAIKPLIKDRILAEEVPIYEKR